MAASSTILEPSKNLNTMSSTAGDETMTDVDVAIASGSDNTTATNTGNTTVTSSPGVGESASSSSSGAKARKRKGSSTTAGAEGAENLMPPTAPDTPKDEDPEKAIKKRKTSKKALAAVSEPTSATASPVPADTDAVNQAAMVRALPKKKTELIGKADGTGEDERMCHQCHRKFTIYVACTAMKTRGKGKTVRCNLVFCSTCLTDRYSLDLQMILSTPRPTDPALSAGHCPETSYIWKCPACNNDCNCSQHRKAAGLPLAGNVKALAEVSGHTVQELLKDHNLFAEAQEMHKKQQEEKAKTGTPKAKSSDGKTEKTPKPEETEEERIRKAEQRKRYKENWKRKQREKAMEAANESGNYSFEVSKSTAHCNSPPVVAVAAPTAGQQTTLSVLPPPPTSPVKQNLKKPDPCAPPEFEFIAVDQPLEVLLLRLRIREFVLRFEPHLQKKLASKYRQIINDPNALWSDLLYKNLILSLLHVIDSSPPPTAPPERAVWNLDYENLEHYIKAIQKAAADSPDIWINTYHLLDEVFDLAVPETHQQNPGEHEICKLEFCGWILEHVLTTSEIKSQLDRDEAKDKKLKADMHEAVRNLQAQWSATREEINKLKLTDPKQAQLQYRSKHADHKRSTYEIERRTWWERRKLRPRTTPLGTDSLGNTYWLFHAHHQEYEDWGHWIVCEKSDSSLKSQPNHSPSGMELEEGHPGRGRKWWAVTGREEIGKLRNWVRWQEEIKRWEGEMCKSPGKRSGLEVRVFLKNGHGATPVDGGLKRLLEGLEGAEKYLSREQDEGEGLSMLQ